MIRLSDVMIVPEIEAALRPLTKHELQGLQDGIVKEGRFLMPLSYAKLRGGLIALVDGHSRRTIWLSDEVSDSDIDEPELQEIASLDGKTVDEAIEWVKQHQAHRRNDESLMKTYLAGQEFNAGVKPSAEIAKEHGMTPSQVRHAGVVAAKIDAAEDDLPGSKETILDSNLKPNHVRTSRDSEDLVLSANVGAPQKQAPEKPPFREGPLKSFAPMTASLAKLSRDINSKVNESGENGWSKAIIKDINNIGRLIQEWQSSQTIARET